jgi:transposase-like protein
MIAPACSHSVFRTNGVDRHGNTRYRCKMCGKTRVEVKPAKPLGTMRIPVADAKQVLRLLTEGMSIRATERATGTDRNTICKLLVYSAMPAVSFSTIVCGTSRWSICNSMNSTPT